MIIITSVFFDHLISITFQSNDMTICVCVYGHQMNKDFSLRFVSRNFFFQLNKEKKKLKENFFHCE